MVEFCQLNLYLIIFQINNALREGINLKNLKKKTNFFFFIKK